MDIKEKILNLLKEEDMTFLNFKDRIINNYKKHFPKSTCSVKLFNQLGTTSAIQVVCYLAKDASESINKILSNDTLSVAFMIHLDRKIDENTSIPDKLTLEINKSLIYIKPKEGSFNVYDSYKFPFRKTTGTPDKILSTLDKYFSTVKITIKDLLKKDMIHNNHIELVKSKI